MKLNKPYPDSVPYSCRVTLLQFTRSFILHQFLFVQSVSKALVGRHCLKQRNMILGCCWVFFGVYFSQVFMSLNDLTSNTSVVFFIILVRLQKMENTQIKYSSSSSCSTCAIGLLK